MIAALARLDPIAVLLSLGALVLCGVELLRMPGDLRWRRGALVASLALLVALAVRLACVHSDFHGHRRVDGIHAFPNPAVTRADLGQTSFVPLGAPARLAEGPWRALVLAGAVAGVVGLGLLAWLAARAAGLVAGLAFRALGSLHPGRVRVAASEDGHNQGRLVGAAARVGADAARRTVRSAWLRLGLTAAACVLAVYGRHAFPFWLAITLALLLPAGRIRPILRSFPFRGGLGLAAVVFFTRRRGPVGVWKLPDSPP